MCKFYTRTWTRNIQKNNPRKINKRQTIGKKSKLFENWKKNHTNIRFKELSINVSINVKIIIIIINIIRTKQTDKDHTNADLQECYHSFTYMS